MIAIMPKKHFWPLISLNQVAQTTETCGDSAVDYSAVELRKAKHHALYSYKCSGQTSVDGA